MGSQAHLRIICSFILIICIFIFYPASIAQADVVDWSSFTRTLNDTFSGNNPHSGNNIIVLVFAILTFVFLAIILRLYFARQKQELKQYEINRERKLSHTDPAEGKQQRRWFRIKHRQNLRWVPSIKASQTKESQREKAELLDISGGGLRFQTTSMLSVGDEITFFLDIGEKKPLSVRGSVLRIEEQATLEQPAYQVAIQFADLRPGERDRLVSWITRGQRDIMHEDKIGASLSTSEGLEEEIISG